MRYNIGLYLKKIPTVKLFATLAGFCIVMAVPQKIAAQAADAKVIVKQVKKTLENVKTLSCNFSLLQDWKEATGSQEIKGRIFIKNPNKFRVETPGQTIVVDGKAVWTYLVKSAQVQVSDFDNRDPNYPSPMTIFKKYSENRTAVIKGSEKVNGSDCTVIELVPRDSMDDPVTVWIDKVKNFPVKSREETGAGERITHTLTNIRTNEGIDDEIFTFSPPKDADVVDMRVK